MNKQAERSFPFGSDQDKGNTWYYREPHPGLFALGFGGLAAVNAKNLLKKRPDTKYGRKAKMWNGIALGASLAGLGLSTYQTFSKKEIAKSDAAARYNKEHNTFYGPGHPVIKEEMKKKASVDYNLKEGLNTAKYTAPIIGGAMGLGLGSLQALNFKHGLESKKTTPEQKEKIKKMFWKKTALMGGAGLGAGLAIGSGIGLLNGINYDPTTKKIKTFVYSKEGQPMASTKAWVKKASLLKTALSKGLITDAFNKAEKSYSEAKQKGWNFRKTYSGTPSYKQHKELDSILNVVDKRARQSNLFKHTLDGSLPYKFTNK
jgi:hypothetical protein